MATAKKEEKKAIMGCASSRHITNLSNLFLPFDIYGLASALDKSSSVLNEQQIIFEKSVKLNVKLVRCI